MFYLTRLPLTWAARHTRHLPVNDQLNSGQEQGDGLSSELSPGLLATANCLLVVRRGLGNRVGLQLNVLDNDLSSSVAGQLDPSGAALQRVSSLEEVVDVAGGLDPSLALVNADLERLGAAGGVLDRCGEPVLRSTLVHVDLERRGDGALDELPLDAVDAATGHAVGEFGPGVRGHVQVVLVAASLVGDLFSNFVSNHW